MITSFGRPSPSVAAAETAARTVGPVERPEHHGGVLRPRGKSDAVAGDLYREGGGFYTILPLLILYGVLHPNEGPERGRILRNSRGTVL